VNETTVTELAAMQSKYGFDEVALDFAHNTAPKTDADGKPVPAAEPQPIAAMGRLSVLSGKGIVFTPTSWTPDGETFYTGRHYKDLSPTVGKNEKGEVNFIHSVALTRAGQIADLHAYSAAGLPTLTTLQTTPTMDTTDLDYKALLLQKLGLPETATDEEIVAKQSAPDVTPLAVVATPEVAALAARLDEMEKTNLIAEATRAGKVINLSAESMKITPLSVVKDLVSQAPVTVPLSATTPAVPGLPALKALSAEDDAVRVRMGYTVEKWRELNPA
jgi:phage I-like protein